MREIVKCPECGSRYRENPNDPGCVRCLMNAETARLLAARHARWLAENDRPGRSIEDLFAILGRKVPGR